MNGYQIRFVCIVSETNLVYFNFDFLSFQATNLTLQIKCIHILFEQKKKKEQIEFHFRYFHLRIYKNLRNSTHL